MITVTTEGANRLRLAFPYNPTFVAFIKGCPGSQFDKETKTWTAPLSVWDTLIAKFPDYVEADYDVWVLVDDRPRRFAQSLLYMGVRLYLDGDQVIADGPGVSPLLQEEVTKRAAAIAQLLRTNALVNPDSTPVRPQAVRQVILMYLDQQRTVQALTERLTRLEEGAGQPITASNACPHCGYTKIWEMPRRRQCKRCKAVWAREE